MLFDNLKYINRINSGSYGSVSEYKLSDNSLVAVKTINLTNQLSDDTISELTTLQILKNKPYIIQIFRHQN